MLKAKFPTAHHFTVSLFGCQYHAEAPSSDKKALISRFDSLVKPSALHVEELEQDVPPAKIWMSYWASPQTFKAWWESAAVLSFWESLPLDSAGFWRETISLPATRAMYMSNKDWPTGFGSCGELVPLTSRSGYWGAYRSRLTPDGPEDKFASELESVPTPRPLGEVRSGRISMTSFPDNICFVVEGQDYTAMGEKEKSYWDENLSPLADEWIDIVLNGGPSHGLLSARGCHTFTSHKTNGLDEGNKDTIDHSNEAVDPALASTTSQRKAQLLFWLDLSKMEEMGKNDETHVKLRGNFVKAVQPGGGMHGGDLMLWVDLGVLKGEEIDAEYVGCYDGTGFLTYDAHPAFSSEKIKCDGRLELPAFFDEPVPSNPEEW